LSAWWNLALSIQATVKKFVDKLPVAERETAAKNNIRAAFVFKIINCTFALPLLGMECLIKINLL